MKPIKIGFVLLSSSRQPQPSTRIAVLNMFPFLRAANFDPHVVFEPERPDMTPDIPDITSHLLQEGFDIVYFQKVRGRSAQELARRLSEAGIKTVYGVCDFIDIGMAAATDITLAVTEYLKSLYPSALQPKIHVVHDGIEHPEIHKSDWGIRQSSRGHPLRALLVTSVGLDHLPVLGAPPDWLEVSIVGRYPPVAEGLRRVREAVWTLAAKKGWPERFAYFKFLTDRRIKRLAWDPVNVYEMMRHADIGIIPIETSPRHEPGQLPPPWKIKSENRLTMKMCVGLPVVATPIPAYESVVVHQENGFLASSLQEWLECLETLRDPVIRRAAGQRARESVVKRYSMQEQARRMIEALRRLGES